MARRVEGATGIRVRIGKLVYELLTSTFVASDVVAGPARRPYLTVPQLKAELSLLAGGPGITLALVDARRPRVRASQSWLGRLYRFPVHRQATVKLGRLREGRISIALKGGAIELDTVELTVKNLHVPVTPASVAPALTGALSLTAATVRLKTVELLWLRLEGTFTGKQLEVRRLTLGLPGGTIELAGTIGLGAGATGPGPFALEGPLKIDAGPTGTVSLSGPSLSKLTLRGKLAGVPPAAGGLKGAPALNLSLEVGRRRVRGTLRRWRVR